MPMSVTSVRSPHFWEGCHTGDSGDVGGIELVPVGRFADRVIEHLELMSDAQAMDFWKDQNTMGLKQFWACNPGDALELKKKMELLRNQKAEQSAA